jgi:biotin transport system ATP-binding protein
VILAESLFFRHAGAEQDTLADLSFRIEAGQLCCLIGVNGSGKSSLLGVLAGLYPAGGGTLRITGRRPPDVRGGEGKRVLVPQDPDMYLFGSLVEEDLLLALDPEDPEQRRKALELAGRFSLDHLLRQPVHILSHGQKRKLCMASALASDPDLLLLDEPFAGLDHPSVLGMRDALARNREDGMTQIVAGHDLDLVADLADTFLLLRQGTLICQGEGQRIFPRCLEAGVRPPCWWFSGGDGPLWLPRS